MSFASSILIMPTRFSPSPPACQMVPQFGALLPLTVAVALQQTVGRSWCCADTDISTAEEGAPLPADLWVAECSPSDVPLQNDPGRGLDCQGLGKCEVGGYLETPERGKRLSITMVIHNVVHPTSPNCMRIQRCLKKISGPYLVTWSQCGHCTHNSLLRFQGLVLPAVETLICAMWTEASQTFCLHSSALYHVASLRTKLTDL